MQYRQYGFMFHAFLLTLLLSPSIGGATPPDNHQGQR